MAGKQMTKNIFKGPPAKELARRLAEYQKTAASFEFLVAGTPYEVQGLTAAQLAREMRDNIDRIMLQQLECFAIPKFMIPEKPKERHATFDTTS